MRAAGSTHVGFGHAGGVLDLAKKHLCLVHAPALPQLLLFGAQAVLGRILGLQQHVFTLGLLTGRESAFREGFGVEAREGDQGEGGAQLGRQGKGSGPGQGTQPGVRSAVKGWSAMGSLRGRAKRRVKGAGAGPRVRGGLEAGPDLGVGRGVIRWGWMGRIGE